MSTSAEEVKQGRPLTPEEEILVDWYLEGKRTSLQVVNEGLRGIATISFLLLILALAFFDRSRVGDWPLRVGCALLLLSLLAAQVGLTFGRFHGGNDLGRLRAFRNALEVRKVCCYLAAFVCLFLALLAFVLGLTLPG